MAERKWERSKACYCEHVKHEVALETELLYPADALPDPPRVLAHRCSDGQTCNRFSELACMWAGTNLNYDPFRQ